MTGRWFIFPILFMTAVAFQNCSEVSFHTSSLAASKAGDNLVNNDEACEECAETPLECLTFHEAFANGATISEVVDLKGADLIAQNTDFGQKHFINAGRVEVSNIMGPVFVQASSVGTIQDIKGPVCIVTSGSVTKVANVLGPIGIIGTASGRSIVSEIQNTDNPYLIHVNVRKIGSLNNAVDDIYVRDSEVGENSSSASIVPFLK